MAFGRAFRSSRTRAGGLAPGRIAARRVTVALHGYTHEDYADGFEFQAAPDLERRVVEGRAYLERVLHVPIHVFVPPHNALSKRGLEAVSAAGLDILG
jgi:predicted deacetylase